jgi:hypothetical protein
MNRIQRPAFEEIPETYRGYVALAEGDDLIAALRASAEETVSLVRSVAPERESYRYGQGKWTIREVLGHIVDAERVFAYRALRLSRHDATPLPGFDENAYVPRSGAADRTLRDLSDEYAAVRAASAALFPAMNAGMLDFLGTVNSRPMSARVLGWIIAGHNLHHLAILRERYFA